jgi:hypothetical protein
MHRVLPTCFTPAAIGIAVTACGVDPSYMGAQSREISQRIGIVRTPSIPGKPRICGTSRAEPYPGTSINC